MQLEGGFVRWRRVARAAGVGRCAVAGGCGGGLQLPGRCLPTTFPSRVQLRGALSGGTPQGFFQTGAYQRQAGQPALGLVHVGPLHLQVARTRLGRQAALGARCGAGHGQCNLALAREVAQGYTQVGGFNAGLQGVQQQALQLQGAARLGGRRGLPAAFGGQCVDAQQGGADGCGFAGGTGACGADICREAHHIALHLRAHAACQRRGRPGSVQCVRAQVAQFGLALQRASARGVAALQGDGAGACVHGGAGHGPAGAVVVGIGLQSSDGQAGQVPRACQFVAQLCVDGPASGRSRRTCAGPGRPGGPCLHGAMQLGGRGLRPQRCQIDGAQRGLGRLQGLWGPGRQRGLHVGLHGFCGEGWRCSWFGCGWFGRGWGRLRGPGLDCRGADARLQL